MQLQQKLEDLNAIIDSRNQEIEALKETPEGRRQSSMFNQHQLQIAYLKQELEQLK